MIDLRAKIPQIKKDKRFEIPIKPKVIIIPNKLYMSIF